MIIDPVSRETFKRHFPDVSRETMAKLDRYVELLIEWQNKMNLVGPATLPQVWIRHILDSAQLLNHLPDDLKNLVDIGSGAGFPGMVLAIMGVKHVNLIEATQKKARFLETVAQELGVKVKIHPKRTEDSTGILSLIVTARAVGPLKELIPLAYPFVNKGGTMLFLKGRNLQEELTESAKDWHFTSEIIQSLSDPSGNVLKLMDIKRRQRKK